MHTPPHLIVHLFPKQIQSSKILEGRVNHAFAG